MKNKTNFIDNYETLKELTSEFDSNTGSTLCNIETLKNITTELGRIAEDVDNTDKSNMTDMALRLRDVDHVIMILSELMRYTTEELEETFHHTQMIKESYFDLIVKAEKR